MLRQRAKFFKNFKKLVWASTTILNGHKHKYTLDTKRICICLPLFSIGFHSILMRKIRSGAENQREPVSDAGMQVMGDRHKIYQCPRTFVIGYKRCPRQGMGKKAAQTLGSRFFLTD